MKKIPNPHYSPQFGFSLEFFEVPDDPISTSGEMSFFEVLNEGHGPSVIGVDCCGYVRFQGVSVADVKRELALERRRVK